jgi:hypothetical protein
MAYTINKYNTNQLTIVQDGTLDQTTDIKLVGKNYAGYGEIQNENFVFLLENFAGANQPPRAITGQLWFDTANSKLKFNDGTKWRTTGGAEISATAPAGLATGDFWWDTTNEQLYSYNGTDFILIGPQDAGAGITQMQSKSVRDTLLVSRSVIAATVNDEVMFLISPIEFTIDPTDAQNAISGFDVVRAGVTLKNTLSATGGVTSSTQRFHGTATNADKLNGIAASNYVTATPGSPSVFTEITNFQTDAGIAIGAGLDLKIFVENDNQGVIQNSQGNEIRFKTKQTGGLNKNVFTLGFSTNTGAVETPATGSVARPSTSGLITIKPGLNSAGTAVESTVLGDNANQFTAVYATNFWGTSEKASRLMVGNVARTAAVDSIGTGTANSIAVRDGSGYLNAVLFQGTATSARYADLAEKYSTAEELAPGTAVAVCACEDHDVEPAKASDHCIGVVSTAPAYMMNSDSEGQYIGLKGRLPVRVKGAVKKGQAVYAMADGVCTTLATTAMVGIAVESNADESEKLVECVLKV